MAYETQNQLRTDTNRNEKEKKPKRKQKVKSKTIVNVFENTERKCLLTGTLRKYVYSHPYNKKTFH